MVIFFTSVGFHADIKIIKQGGIKLIIFLILVTVLIVCQNIIALGVSKLIGVSSYLGITTGSISMTGGHGTSAAFGPILEDLGLVGATTLCSAAATYGLVAGSIIGGPLGRKLILKYDLVKTAIKPSETVLEKDKLNHKVLGENYAYGLYEIILAMGLGTIISELLYLAGLTLPTYIGSMIIAVIMRNVSESTGKYTLHIREINDIGGIALSLFLGVAMVTLKLWQLAKLAIPLIILLLSQTIFMVLYARYVVYNVMGRNYDAAILTAGVCGFGMGATPNAMANMESLTEKYAPSELAFILVPIVGGIFVDFINSFIISIFINIL